MWNGSWWHNLAAAWRRWRITQLTNYYEWRYPQAHAIPSVGQEVYAEGQLHLSHGEDDFAGGRARVKVDEGSNAWIELAEQPGPAHNWEFLGRTKCVARPLRAGQSSPAPDDRAAFHRWD